MTFKSFCDQVVAALTAQGLDSHESITVDKTRQSVHLHTRSMEEYGSISATRSFRLCQDGTFGYRFDTEDYSHEEEFFATIKELVA